MAPPPPESSPPAPAPLRVLVVDDNADAAETLSMLLEELAHDVHTASSGKEALALVAALRPAVVFLDLGLPDLDGLEVARRVRAEPYGAGVVLVAVTGWGQEKDRQETRAAGFDHHFVKPLDPVALEAFLAGPALADTAKKA